MRKVIPSNWLYKLEPMLRGAYALSHRGNAIECNVCNRSFKGFIHDERHKICPACGSIERNRRLWKLLNDQYLTSVCRILDFSPSRSIYRALQKRQDVDYIATDLSTDFIADNAYDITKLPLENESIDLIICYHILEHVPEDVVAMQELHRVLRPNGKCLIQTPFKPGDIYEDETITSPTDRLKHFGQEDHVRIYSVHGLKGRLEQVGFKVSILEFHEPEDNRYGFSVNEIIIECTKV